MAASARGSFFWSNRTMSDSPRELSKELYEATFSPPMKDVTATAEELVSLWEYLDPVIEELFHSCTAWDWRVMYIYESQDGHYQHSKVPVPKDNTYLSVIVDKPNKKIVGHYFLDLGALLPNRQDS